MQSESEVDEEGSIGDASDESDGGAGDEGTDEEMNEGQRQGVVQHQERGETKASKKRKADAMVQEADS